MNATLREVHEGIRELYTCDLCGFTHHRPEGLLDHKNKAHSTKYQVNKNSQKLSIYSCVFVISRALI